MFVSIEKSNATQYGVFLDVCLNDEVVIYGCKIVNAKNGGKFVSMPQRKGNDDKYYAHVRFKDRALQDEFSHLVISAYEGNSWANEPEKAKKPSDPNDVWEE